eukprot:141005_1
MGSCLEASPPTADAKLRLGTTSHDVNTPSGSDFDEDIDDDDNNNEETNKSSTTTTNKNYEIQQVTKMIDLNTTIMETEELEDIDLEKEEEKEKEDEYEDEYEA